MCRHKFPVPPQPGLQTYVFKNDPGGRRWSRGETQIALDYLQKAQKYLSCEDFQLMCYSILVLARHSYDDLVRGTTIFTKTVFNESGPVDHTTMRMVTELLKGAVVKTDSGFEVLSDPWEVV